MSCINKNNPQFRTLVSRSGLKETIVEAICGIYLDKKGRFPYLDELPNSNSESALKEALKVKQNGYCKTENILNFINATTVEEAQIKLNNEFRDLQIKLITTGDTTYVDIEHRPNNVVNKDTEPVNFSHINSTVTFNKIFEKLNKLYGIQIIPITTDELASEEWQGIVFNPSYTKGFIYNGNIYINTDNATLDTPTHELLHIMLGGIKFQEPNLYLQLVSSVQQLSDFKYLMSQQEGKTQNDAMEEIFISEFAKALSGKNNEIAKLPQTVIEEIFYNINRILDSMLMGDVSTNLINVEDLADMSLKQIATEVNSHELENNCAFALSDGEIHRIAANEKQDLMRKGELEEYCE
jgi:hypothetical protein